MSLYQMNKQDTIDVDRLETDLMLADFELQKLIEGDVTYRNKIKELRVNLSETDPVELASTEDDQFLKNMEIQYAELDIKQIQLNIQTIENQYNYNIPT